MPPKLSRLIEQLLGPRVQLAQIAHATSPLFSAPYLFRQVRSVLVRICLAQIEDAGREGSLGRACLL